MVVDFDLPPGPTAPSIGRWVVRAAAPDLGDTTHETVELLTSEVVTNVLRHARPAPDSDIRLRVERAEHNIRVEVESDGPAFTPEIPTRPDEAATSGYGLYLVDRLSSAWGVNAEGDRTKVWFEVSDRDE